MNLMLTTFRNCADHLLVLSDTFYECLLLLILRQFEIQSNRANIYDCWRGALKQYRPASALRPKIKMSLA